MLLSLVIRNSFWVLLAVTLCLTPLLYGETAMLMGREEAAALCLILFLSSLFMDTVSRKGDDASWFMHNITILLISSLALFYAAKQFGFFVERAHDALVVLCFFVLFRGASYAAKSWRYPEWMGTRVMLFGDGSFAQETAEIIANSNGRYILSDVVSFSGENHNSYDNHDELLAKVNKAGVSNIVVSFPERRGVMPVNDILRCRMQGISVVDAAGFYEQATRKLYIENLTPSWFIFSPGFCFSFARRAVKRVFDLALALVGLCVFAPLFPVIALLVYATSPGPVFFRQIRVGRRGALFQVIKFRTMRADAEKHTGAVWASDHDPRVTSVGAFLRKTRLDEIPQLINVLVGDMSLVGPRPERPEFICELEKGIPFYSERHAVKPGVTGWAQIRYPYGASVEDALEKLRYDLYYIKHQSLLFDLEIVMRTIPVVIFGRGAR